MQIPDDSLPNRLEYIALPDEVDPKETLYRILKRSTPEFITEDKKVLPGLFKDPRGVSVNRDGGMDDHEAVRFILNDKTFARRTKAVTSVSAAYCYDIGTDIEAAPTDENPYHANIFLSKEENKRNLQALQLADQCRIVYYNDDLEWIYLTF